MLPFCKGRFRARLAETSGDLRAVQRLRYLAFRQPGAGRGARDGLDRDAFDAHCRHLMIETEGGDLVATCRFLSLGTGNDLSSCYSAQFYDLQPLRGLRGPKLEIGRFCLAEGQGDPDVLRIAWAGLTRMVEALGAVALFGCSSFPGTDPATHRDALALLGARHRPPEGLGPGQRGGEVVALPAGPFDERQALQQMPGLLRSYLAMGGWVSDHAVIDRDLGTLHVLTVVDIAAIPPARARLLRADAV
ncbi:GNAT family N-acetyltransferase [Rhodobacter sp. HX-7-19]|uniref:L-ornithine N(alpha)-acyltransferase n=1 Tax=Paragemmobacter kunshanensis TaxID=2583234 RepID=A0A6M1U0D3_9RHOB|nr:GNAT family N-acetyltransferase [Rhodobacter kunshanensis]